MKNFYLYLNILDFDKKKARSIALDELKKISGKHLTILKDIVDEKYEYALKVSIEDDKVEEMINHFLKIKIITIVDHEIGGGPQKVKIQEPLKKDISRFLK